MSIVDKINKINKLYDYNLRGVTVGITLKEVLGDYPEDSHVTTSFPKTSFLKNDFSNVEGIPNFGKLNIGKYTSHSYGVFDTTTIQNMVIGECIKIVNMRASIRNTINTYLNTLDGHRGSVDTSQVYFLKVSTDPAFNFGIMFLLKGRQGLNYNNLKSYYIDDGNMILSFRHTTHDNQIHVGKSTADIKEIGISAGYEVGQILCVALEDDIIQNYWMRCDGRLLTSDVYPELFDLIGTTYNEEFDRPNSRQGVTNFRIPNYNGRYLRVVNDNDYRWETQDQLLEHDIKTIDDPRDSEEDERSGLTTSDYSGFTSKSAYRVKPIANNGDYGLDNIKNSRIRKSLFNKIEIPRLNDMTETQKADLKERLLNAYPTDNIHEQNEGGLFREGTENHPMFNDDYASWNREDGRTTSYLGVENDYFSPEKYPPNDTTPFGDIVMPTFNYNTIFLSHYIKYK